VEGTATALGFLFTNQLMVKMNIKKILMDFLKKKQIQTSAGLTVLLKKITQSFSMARLLIQAEEMVS
jgi:hypothetical protein